MGLTANSSELATAVKDMESKTIDGYLMNSRGSCTVDYVSLQVPLDLLFLPLVPSKSLLFSSLFNSLVTRLCFFIVYSSIDELHMSIALRDPAFC